MKSKPTKVRLINRIKRLTDKYSDNELWASTRNRLEWIIYKEGKGKIR